MTGDLRPYCCVAAEFDGFTPEEHAQVCREQQPNPGLSDRPTTGGQQT